jgi:hypothetical protein
MLLVPSGGTAPAAPRHDIPFARDVKTPGWREASPGVQAARFQEAEAGRFIWQLVGVLATYGSICLTGTNV